MYSLENDELANIKEMIVQTIKTRPAFFSLLVNSKNIFVNFCFIVFFNGGKCSSNLSKNLLLLVLVRN
jgi:hypothetical protein